ncbi:hypothetical protein N665_2785s0005 [Sinapis alba]|nr:hypothetical protein N665_2785s0005 [Sinapis alba]
MSIEMDRNESYVFNISGDHLYQSSFESFSSPSSSSIGRNSDDDDGEDSEAESQYKGPLDLMEALEEVLPVRKGISNYYNGKSKSFTNLGAASSALASSSSIKDLAKPENPYSRRRRNLLCHQIRENSKTTPRGKILKKQFIMGSSKSALTLAMAVAAGEVSSSGGDSSTGTSPTTSGSPPRQMMLPPVYPRSQGSFGKMKFSQSSTVFSAWRSCSVADIPRCFPATANGIGSTKS